MMMVMTITKIDGPATAMGRQASTRARGHAGTQERRHTGTRARRHAGTQALGHASTQAGRQASRQTRRLRKRSKTAPQKFEQSLVLQKGSQPVPGWVEVPALSAVSSPEFTPSGGGLVLRSRSPGPHHAESPRHGDWEFPPRGSKLPAASPMPHRFTCVSEVCTHRRNITGLSTRAVMSWGCRVHAKQRCHRPPRPGAQRRGSSGPLPGNT